MQQSDPGTLPQLSHCPGSCPRCPNRVVLPGLLLIFHDGNQLVPVGAVLDSLFGSRLSALILAPPTSDDITEGSSQGPAPSSSGLAERRQEVPRFFLDFLQSKMRHGGRGRGRGRGGGGGGGGGGGRGRGCFGMKMDRIGSISGLGC
ncbi:hypothetical protein JOQ06_024780 [Pogonophryne albipinna]|uniref:Uncharacterized protein n=1 Tax=Pogonophryne albipinna TaxID=1090488 RepID=A0AAD6A882_9TELE|nr:hypothetical protein JOQ06_024780 [Pogonophryne albipinna]